MDAGAAPAAVKRVAVLDGERCVGCQCCMFACARLHQGGGVAESRIHVQSAGGFRKGFVVVVCRACPDPPCAAACPHGALQLRSGGGVRLRRDRCTACGACRQACPFGAIARSPVDGRPLLCVYCGYCTRYCPFGVIAWQRVAP